MTAFHKNQLLAVKLLRILPEVCVDDANTLRRAQLTLHRWAEEECGDSNGGGSRAIERDEETGKPYVVRHWWGDGKAKTITTRTLIPDREAGALRRVKEVCDRLGMYFYHQTDPRGCQLYVSNEPLTDQSYTNGVACCV